jgi:hypothetical protein
VHGEGTGEDDGCRGPEPPDAVRGRRAASAKSRLRRLVFERRAVRGHGWRWAVFSHGLTLWELADLQLHRYAGKGDDRLIPASFLETVFPEIGWRPNGSSAPRAIGSAVCFPPVVQSGRHFLQPDRV